MGAADPILYGDGVLTLFALFKPLFQSSLLKMLSLKSSKCGPKISSLSRLAALLRCNDVPAAVNAAQSIYRALGIPMANLPAGFDVGEPNHLLAALLIPVKPDQLTSFAGVEKHRIALTRKWISPTRTKTNRK